jgi:hypothetical protein
MTSSRKILSLALVLGFAFGAFSVPAQPQACPDEKLHVLPLQNPQHVEIPPQTQEMTFAQRNQLSLKLRTRDIQEISVSWQSPDRGVLAPISEPSLQHDSEGSGLIEVVPPALGKLRLELMIVFQDCFFQEATINVSVPVPTEPPEGFVLAWTNWRYARKIGIARMDFGDFSGLVVTPLAFYRGFDRAAPILGDDVAFSLIAPEGQKPSIAFDSSHRSVTPLRVGQALIKGSFRGKSDYICVDVTRNATTASRNSDCHDLLPSGKTIPAEPADVPERGQTIAVRKF